MSRSRLSFTKFPLTAITLTLTLVGLVLVGVAFSYYHGRQSKATLNTVLSGQFDPQLRNRAISSFKVSPAGLMFVAGGQPMCLINFNSGSPERYHIVEIAQKAGCGPDSKVMQLDQVQSSMGRGFGASFVLLGEDESFSADRQPDGTWSSTIDVQHASAEKAERLAFAVMEDVEGFFNVLSLAPSEPVSPVSLQERWSR